MRQSFPVLAQIDLSKQRRPRLDCSCSRPTLFHFICIFGMHYWTVKHNCSSFRTITHHSRVASDSVTVQKVAGRSWDQTRDSPSDDWKIFCQPSNKWVFFTNQGRISQRKGWGFAFQLLCQKIQGASNPYCVYGY